MSLPASIAPHRNVFRPFQLEKSFRNKLLFKNSLSWCFSEIYIEVFWFFPRIFRENLCFPCLCVHAKFFWELMQELVKILTYCCNRKCNLRFGCFGCFSFSFHFIPDFETFWNSSVSTVAEDHTLFPRPTANTCPFVSRFFSLNVVTCPIRRSLNIATEIVASDLATQPWRANRARMFIDSQTH